MSLPNFPCCQGKRSTKWGALKSSLVTQTYNPSHPGVEAEEPKAQDLTGTH